MTVTTVSQERNYAQVPRGVLYHPQLSGNDIRVYATLSDRAGRKDMAWPSVRRVADDLNMSTSTVRGCLDRLERVGVVEVERGAGSVNRYHLPLKGVANIATPRSEYWEGGVAESATEQDTRTRTVEASTSNGFTEFNAKRAVEAVRQRKRHGLLVKSASGLAATIQTDETFRTESRRIWSHRDCPNCHGEGSVENYSPGGGTYHLECQEPVDA